MEENMNIETGSNATGARIIGCQPPPLHHYDQDPDKKTLHSRRGYVIFDQVQAEDISFELFDGFLGIRVKSDLDGFMPGAPFYIHDHRDGVLSLAIRWASEEDPEKKMELLEELK